MTHGRAGWYSNHLLHNLVRSSAREIVVGLQHLEIGHPVPMAPGAPTATNACIGERARFVHRRVAAA